MIASRMRDAILGGTWVWAFAASAIVWLAIIALARGHGGGSTLTVAMQFATFYVIVGLGQMLVVSTGPGNIDLSIPGVMTLSAYLAMAAMAGRDNHIVLGFAIGLATGLGAGAVNAFLCLALRVPPIIATLASGFILQSFAIAVSATSAAKPAPLLLDAVTSSVLGAPSLTVAFIIVTLGVAWILARTTFGRAVLAIGQNLHAARLAGLSVGRTRTIVYVLSGVFSSAAGVFYAAYSGGASLDMASDFNLMSIAIVVLGGTAIGGGQAIPIGLWGAALLLQLLVTLLNVMGATTGIRYVVTGVCILAVLAIAVDRDQGRQQQARSARLPPV